VVFAVAKDPSRPFQVQALHGTATAVGTQFDVQVSGESAAVTVLEGTVAVRASLSPEAPQVAVSAGQAVDYSLDGKLSAPHSVDLGRIRGWQASHLVFSNVSLAAALEDYNRYRTVPIVLGDPQLGERRINGVFRIGDEQAFLGALQQGLHVRVTRTDSQIVLQPQ
jgi:transmembrane sensor